MVDLHDRSALQRACLFQGLTQQELDAVADASNSADLQAGTELFRQGEHAARVWILSRGQVKLVQNTADGQQVLLRFIGPGEVIGIVAALENSVYPATAEANESSIGYHWEGRRLHALMEQYPKIALNAIPFLIARVHDVQEHVRELATERVERRIARVVLRLVRQSAKKVEQGILIDMALTRQDLAEMAGTTLYTVSRLLQRWESRGLVKVGRKRVVICAPHSLVAIAEDLPEGNAQP